MESVQPLGLRPLQGVQLGAASPTELEALGRVPSHAPLANTTHGATWCYVEGPVTAERVTDKEWGV